MDTLRRLFPLLLGLFAVICFGHSMALADGGAVPVDPAGLGALNLLSLVIIAGCMGATWALRNFTVPEHWSHSPLWGLVSSLVAGVGSALPPAISARGVSREVVIVTVFGVLFTALAQSKPVGKSTAAGLGMILLVGLGLTAGCATGADGLRQACTTADTILTGAYQTTASLYHARKTQLQAELTPATVEKVKAAWETDESIVGKVLTALDAATNTKNGLCALLPAVESGQRKDWAALVAQLTQVGLDVRTAVAELQKLTASNPPRMVAVHVQRNLLVWRWV